MSLRVPFHDRVRAVIFDWAGTIVDHGSLAPIGVFMQAFELHGIPVRRELARGPMGMHKRAHVATVLSADEVVATFQRVKGRAPTDADVDAIYVDVVRLQLACLKDFADPIPGALDVVAWLRSRGTLVGSTTGYVREMMDVLAPIVREKGYAPDVTIAADEVAAARPSPLMALAAVVKLGAWPVQACVKVGDTISDVQEGLHAGMWTVALALSGNESGLTYAEVCALSEGDREALRQRATARLRAAGAHFVIDSVASLPPVIEEIERRLASGEGP